jgi:hypothetical protein
VDPLELLWDVQADWSRGDGLADIGICNKSSACLTRELPLDRLREAFVPAVETM